MSRIFMTGASGYIGTSIVEIAIPRGYQIYGLSRSERSDAKLTALGVTPVRGDLSSFDVLRDQSAQADIVLHLADSLTDDYTQDYAQVIQKDHAAVDAMGAGLEGSNKVFITTSGSLIYAPTGAQTNEESTISDDPLNGRIISEKYALKLAEKGIRASAIRLAPFVYGRGGSGVKLFMSMFTGSDQVLYVNDGSTLTSTVHVDDAAELYLLAAEKAQAGDVFNGTSGTASFRELSEAIGEIFNLPVASIPFDDAVGKFGPFFARFLSSENNVSGQKAVDVLGWEPKQKGILEDIKTGSYPAVAAALKST